MLGIGGIDRVVYVNNWLLATNPSHGLAAHRVADVTARLIAAWPDRAVVFRSVNADLDRTGFDALRNAGYGFVRSRDVYLVDTREEGFGQHNNVRIDLAQLDRTPYEIVSDPERLAPYARRMSEVYRAVYLAKYVIDVNYFCR